jgi:hypothetical protein
MTLTITILCHNDKGHAQCHILFILVLNVIMLSLVMMSAVTMNVVMLRVVMLNVVMLSVVMLCIIVLSVVAPNKDTYLIKKPNKLFLSLPSRGLNPGNLCLINYFLALNRLASN